jgi:hypothetical protein
MPVRSKTRRGELGPSAIRRLATANYPPYSLPRSGRSSSLCSMLQYWRRKIILVRWLSGRKQRFAKAPYPKRVPRVRIPPSPFPRWMSFTFAAIKVKLKASTRKPPSRGATLREASYCSRRVPDTPISSGGVRIRLPYTLRQFTYRTREAGRSFMSDS